MSARTIGLAGVALGGLLTLATLPAILAPAVTRTALTCGSTIVGPVEVIAATIRQFESGSDYTAQAPGSTASGAYQFLDSSWASFGGYPRAYLAPPTVQDAKAVEYIAAVLAANGGDVGGVPVVWYLGHVPPAGSPEWDTVPSPGAGNRLTPRQYQGSWMDLYRTNLAEHRGTPGSDKARATEPAAPACDGGRGEALPGGWSLPGPRDVLNATADQIDNPHHDYPAWDWSVPTGTPIYAMRGGTVVSITTYPDNCHGQRACEACGLGVTISDEQGLQWTYCHGAAHHVNQGDKITAGQQILTSGNSGNSTGPHLHLGIRTNGTPRCPQPLVAALFHHGVGIDPTTLPTAGCAY
jgi:hypothetical protein